MKTLLFEPLRWIDDELERLHEDQLARRVKSLRRSDSAHVTIDGRQLVNFGSNDYLGLATDPRLADAVNGVAHEVGWGSGASPLISGYGPQLNSLESHLARFAGRESAVVFSSGFAGNVGAVTTLAAEGDAVFSDAANHASLIDGCRLSRARVFVYSHGDCRALEEMLRTAGSYRRRLIVTESLFSMDGDFAPLPEIADLSAQHKCMLLVDEAHTLGVFGPGGRGCAAGTGVDDRVDVCLGTLSKALGGSGGFACGSRAVVEWMRNRARTYVFSTAPPPAVAAAADCALSIVESEPNRRTELLDRAGQLRAELRGQGWDLGQSQSQIIPIILGSSTRALELSARLGERGLFVPAIRPPSVARHGSRLRISLSYAHDTPAIETLIAALGELRSAMA